MSITQLTSSLIMLAFVLAGSDVPALPEAVSASGAPFRTVGIVGVIVREQMD
ncbi:hypothetical protein [Alicyclobacillus herbarius]|uniref:hypothetical protein n=1 Tax=Alicyclobacillus herbarius TaxID=122960 RepID=UPI000422D01A|nr:hypothetical protein [Alicyclobacillus herbarius]